jgi:hypothetical protein
VDGLIRGPGGGVQLDLHVLAGTPPGKIRGFSLHDDGQG